MHAKLLFSFFAATLATASVSKAAVVGWWTFEGGSLLDSTGNFGPLVLGGNATITNGALDVNGTGTTATGWASTSGSGGVAMGSKTIVSWITLQGLSGSANAGSAMTVDSTTVDQFDGIVFGERDANRWMNGSNGFSRTPASFSGAEALESVVPSPTPIMLAITYLNTGTDVTITGYRNGVNMGSFSDPDDVTWAAGNLEVIFGRRHMFPGGTDGPGGLDALIHEARLYDTALTQGEIQALAMVPEPSTAIFGVLTAGFLLARRRR